MKNRLLLLVCILGLAACQSNQVFYHVHNLSNSVWEETNKILFLVDVETSIAQAEVLLLLRLSSRVPTDTLRLAVSITPLGNTAFDQLNATNTVELATSIVLDQEFDRSVNETWDNVVDLEIPLTLPSDFSFNQMGTYAIELAKQAPKGDLPLIRDVGLKIQH